MSAAGITQAHESARAQVAGDAHYIDDLPEVRGTLHAAPILSRCAHGRIIAIDTAAALATPVAPALVAVGLAPGGAALLVRHDQARLDTAHDV